ncbi:MAG TPA: peptidase M61 [Burkholderiaceae bacterium]|nr:peptidase M61 [Burkholderiaceae bacterium]
MPPHLTTRARAALPLAFALAFALAAPALHAQAPVDTPYPGTITLQVDATDLDHRIFRVRETVPVAPGPLRLYYPHWLPGTHGPTGSVIDLTGLAMSASGQPIAWKRDPLDPYAFMVDVPAGVRALEIEFQQLTALERPGTSGRGSGGVIGRVVVTPEIVNLQWNGVLLYPAGHRDSRITVQPSLRLPEGWNYGSALREASRSGAAVTFKPVSVETLIDSPIFAGKYVNRVDLDPDAAQAGRAPVFLNVVGDSAEKIMITPEQLAAHRAMVAQADKVFGARHYAHYDFLLAVSDHLGGIGLEHHQSSENGVRSGYFVDWSKASTGRTLLPHEYTHSWNGKFRRPADLWTPNTNTPMQDSLLWVYEGQTQYWGTVLAARAGLVPMSDMRDQIANTAAYLDAQSGRNWRNLQDTTNQAVMEGRGGGRDWGDWVRGADYYDEMLLIWLEADMTMREASGGQRTMDDFARAFFGPQPGRADADTTPLTYTFDDVVATLNRVQPYDWTRFLRQRLDTNQAGAPLQGLAKSGWKLAWAEEPNSASKGFAAYRQIEDFSYSLGMNVGREARLEGVRWNGPAYKAGLSGAAQLVAIDGVAYTPERLKSAITAAKKTSAPIQLLVRDGDRYRSVAIDYHGGLRYPKLERIEGTEDRLTPLLTAKP